MYVQFENKLIMYLQLSKSLKKVSDKFIMYLQLSKSFKKYQKLYTQQLKAPNKHLFCGRNVCNITSFLVKL